MVHRYSVGLEVSITNEDRKHLIPVAHAANRDLIELDSQCLIGQSCMYYWKVKLTDVTVYVSDATGEVLINDDASLNLDPATDSKIEELDEIIDRLSSEFLYQH